MNYSSLVLSDVTLLLFCSFSIKLNISFINIIFHLSNTPYSKQIQIHFSIYISSFSKLIFEPHEEVIICENPLSECESDSACFIENIDIAPYLDIVDTLIVYHWNRLYPSDVKFNIDIEKSGFVLDSVIEYAGSSHDKITKEIYSKRV